MPWKWELWMHLSLFVLKIISLCACVCLFLKKEFPDVENENALEPT